MINNKTILIEGLGFSGSGAVLDLLREVDDCYVLPTEFRIINDPDGLISLESSLIDNWTVFQGDVAVKRFRKLCKNLTNKYTGPYATLDHSKVFGKEFLPAVDRYLDKLIQMDFHGMWYGNDSYIRRKMIGRNFIGRNRFTTRKMYVPKNLTREEFQNYTCEFISELRDLYMGKKKSGFFVVDGDYSVLNAKKVLRYISCGKMILVVRDPRDIIASVRYGLGAFMPEDLIKNMDWQFSLFNRWHQTIENLPKETFRLIYFEDLITKYDETTNKIFSFLGIDKKLHKRKKTILDPVVSIKNIGLWKNVLSEEEAIFIEQKFRDLYDRF